MVKAFASFIKVSKTAKTMSVVLCVLCAFFLTVGLLITHFVYPFEKALPYTSGLLLGTFFSVLKVFLMEKSIGRSLDMAGKDAKSYAGLMSALRYALTIVSFLCVIFFRDVFGLFGVVIGTLSLQISAYIAGYILKDASPSQL